MTYIYSYIGMYVNHLISCACKTITVTIETMPTVFDSIVTKENDHTNLLRHVMERQPKVAASLLTSIIGREVSQEEAMNLEITTQHIFKGPDGREIPDIVIDGSDFRCVIEAKIDPFLELTEAQRRGYRECFKDRGQSYLCFLVPDGWRYFHLIEQVRAICQPVLVNTVKWSGVIRQLEDPSLAISDEIFLESLRFWKGRFQSNSMTTEERNSLKQWTEQTYSAIQKLEKTVLQAKSLFDARQSETKLQTELETGTDYCGFYIKRDGLNLLWVGIWTKAPAPLCFGVHSKKSSWPQPQGLSMLPPIIADYYLWALPSEGWDDSQCIYDEVNSFLASHYDE